MVFCRQHYWISGRCPYQSNYYHPDDDQRKQWKFQFQKTKSLITPIRRNKLPQATVSYMWAQNLKFKFTTKLDRRHPDVFNRNT